MAKYSYVASIGVDTTAFTNGIKDINTKSAQLDRNLREINKAIKDVESVGGDATTQLAQKQDLLTQRLEKARQKVQQLESIYSQMQTALANGNIDSSQWNSYTTELERARAETTRLTSELGTLNNATVDVGEVTQDTSVSMANNITESGTKIVATLGDILNLIKSVTTALANMVKDPVNSFSQYEQLVGGMETIFKGASDSAIEYANSAYKTIGISANAYMETVTGFSQSLIQSLGGDVVEATELANQALLDMADNSNKMGTSMSALQYAYQGFAKQNYTMLDNLKLGYGGNKTEMERLLEDAEKLSGISYDISSYADIISAIHTIQEELDIAGTTAKEAETTIEGSMKQCQSAFTDLKQALANGNADLDEYLKNFSETLDTMLANLIPAIENVLSRIPSVIEGFTDKAVEIFPELSRQLFSVLEEMLSGLSDISPEVSDALIDGIEETAEGIIDLIPEIAEVGAKIAQEVINAIIETTPELVPELVDMFKESMAAIMVECPALGALMAEKVFSGIVDGSKSAISAIESVANTLPSLSSAFTELGATVSAASVAITGGLVALEVALIAVFEALQSNLDEINAELEASAEWTRAVIADASDDVGVSEDTLNRLQALNDAITESGGLTKANKEEFVELEEQYNQTLEQTKADEEELNALQTERNEKVARLQELDEKINEIEKTGYDESGTYLDLLAEQKSLKESLINSNGEFVIKENLLISKIFQQNELLLRQKELIDEIRGVDDADKYAGMRAEAAKNATKSADAQYGITDEVNLANYNADMQDLENRKKLHKDNLDEDAEYYQAKKEIQDKYRNMHFVASNATDDKGNLLAEGFWDVEDEINEFYEKKAAEEAEAAAAKEEARKKAAAAKEKEEQELLNKTTKWANELTKQAVKAEEEKTKAVEEQSKERLKLTKTEIDEATKAQETYEKALESSQSKIKQSIYEMTDTSTGERAVFSDLGAKTDEIEKYISNYNKLQSMEGVPADLLAEIDSMSWTDRMAVVEELVKMTDKNRTKFFTDYNSYSNAVEKASLLEQNNVSLKNTWLEEEADVGTAVKESLEAVNYEEYGRQSAQAYYDGFASYALEQGLNVGLLANNNGSSGGKSSGVTLSDNTTFNLKLDGKVLSSFTLSELTQQQKQTGKVI